MGEGRWGARDGGEVEAGVRRGRLRRWRVRGEKDWPWEVINARCLGQRWGYGFLLMGRCDQIRHLLLRSRMYWKAS